MRKVKTRGNKHMKPFLALSLVIHLVIILAAGRVALTRVTPALPAEQFIRVHLQSGFSGPSIAENLRLKNKEVSNKEVSMIKRNNPARPSPELVSQPVPGSLSRIKQIDTPPIKQVEMHSGVLPEITPRLPLSAKRNPAAERDVSKHLLEQLSKREKFPAKEVSKNVIPPRQRPSQETNHQQLPETVAGSLQRKERKEEKFQPDNQLVTFSSERESVKREEPHRQQDFQSISRWEPGKRPEVAGRFWQGRPLTAARDLKSIRERKPVQNFELTKNFISERGLEPIRKPRVGGPQNEPVQMSKTARLSREVIHMPSATPVTDKNRVSALPGMLRAVIHAPSPPLKDKSRPFPAPGVPKEVIPMPFGVPSENENRTLSVADIYKGVTPTGLRAALPKNDNKAPPISALFQRTARALSNMPSKHENRASPAPGTFRESGPTRRQIETDGGLAPAKAHRLGDVAPAKMHQLSDTACTIVAVEPEPPLSIGLVAATGTRPSLSLPNIQPGASDPERKEHPIARQGHSPAEHRMALPGAEGPAQQQLLTVDKIPGRPHPPAPTVKKKEVNLPGLDLSSPFPEPGMASNRELENAHQMVEEHRKKPENRKPERFGHILQKLKKTQEVEEGTEEDAVEAESAEKAVTVLKRVKPVYPPVARRLGLEGTVVLSVRIDKEGIPREVSVAQSSGRWDFDVSALEAVKQWRFQPPEQDQDVSARWIKVSIQFKLTDS